MAATLLPTLRLMVCAILLGSSAIGHKPSARAQKPGAAAEFVCAWGFPSCFAVPLVPVPCTSHNIRRLLVHWLVNVLERCQDGTSASLLRLALLQSLEALDAIMDSCRQVRRHKHVECRGWWASCSFAVGQVSWMFVASVALEGGGPRDASAT